MRDETDTLVTFWYPGSELTTLTETGGSNHNSKTVGCSAQMHRRLSLSKHWYSKPRNMPRAGWQERSYQATTVPRYLDTYLGRYRQIISCRGALCRSWVRTWGYVFSRACL